jgi:C4-dicarboxylate-specific signal transduction histidine kinase
VLEVVRSQEIYANAAGYCEELEAAKLLEEALAAARPFLSEAGIEVVQQLEEGLPPFISQRSRLLQILVHMLKNSAEALAGAVAPRVELQVQRCGDKLLFRVRDNGPGVAAEIRDAIFQFGFSTRPQGNGFGLHYGSTSALELGGNLQLENTPSGASFLLTLPLRH